MLDEVVVGLKIVCGTVIVVAILGHKKLLREYRIRGYSRGRRLEQRKRGSKIKGSTAANGLRFGSGWLPESAATQHFLVSGTTGSGKSQVQRLLMREPLIAIGRGADSRALIYDAKGETTAYLKRIGVTAQVYSLNPFEARSSSPMAVAWDIAKDITSPARALNLSCSLIKQDRSGSNQYFSDAGRLVVTGVVESFIRHSGSEWTFSDLVYTTLSRKRIEQVLCRDKQGREIAEGLLGDERTGYAVASTVISKMRYYSSVAALWQRSNRKISIRQWLTGSSILLLGTNATASASLDALNEQIFKVMVEEIDLQTNSSKRRTWVWLDEARLAGSILRSESLSLLAVKGRSRGACLVLAFQDIEGFKEAAGSRVAAEIIAQCSNKALLRAESDETATWSSKLLGQFETLEVFRSESSGQGLRLGNQNSSEQRVVKDSVLPSEFYDIPVTNKQNGLTGYFISASFGAQRVTIPPSEVERVVVSESQEKSDAIVYRPEADQWIRDWSEKDKRRLSLSCEKEIGVEVEHTKKRKLRLLAPRENLNEKLPQ